jgi:hypothetical protein
MQPDAEALAAVGACLTDGGWRWRPNDLAQRKLGALHHHPPAQDGPSLIPEGSQERRSIWGSSQE